jgi:hypothetical protein
MSSWSSILTTVLAGGLVHFGSRFPTAPTGAQTDVVAAYVDALLGGWPPDHADTVAEVVRLSGVPRPEVEVVLRSHCPLPV